MKVHKLGGASVKDAETIRRIPGLLRMNSSNQLFLVISAMGKTTNKLERITNLAFAGNDFSDAFSALEEEHLNIFRELLPNCEEKASNYQYLQFLFKQCSQVIDSTDKKDYDFFYDQVVSFGERFSSYIISEFLKQEGLDVALVDAGTVLRSDDNWRAGNIDMEASSNMISNVVERYSNRIIITQGFIAKEATGAYVTLGREGSDYSAGLIAAFTNADELIFWKDVDGIYNADPKMFDNVVKIDKISYEEMVELSFFGAKVLHEKTLYALKERNVILSVKSFLHPEREGTYICCDLQCTYPPIRIVLPNQILITAEPIDKKLIDLSHIKQIYGIAEECNVNVNLIQTAATKLSFCATYDEYNCHKLLSGLGGNFKVRYNENVFLETIRHYTRFDLSGFAGNEKVLLSQVTRACAQYVMSY